MAGGYQRASDATFDLNLAPILDIIVSVVPMLLLSIAFIQVKMIETPVPQVVAEAIKRADEKAETTLTLKVAKSGFTLEVVKDGKSTPTLVPNKDGKWDLEGLHARAFGIKEQNPQMFRVDIAPEADVNLRDIVIVMDRMRKNPHERKVAFVDPKDNQKIETELMYPNILFSNVIGN
jgi:biopolymer transport protein ExbD